MAKIAVCKICGKEFEGRTANATMCSAECRRINNNRRCVESQRKRRQLKKERIAAGLEEGPKPRKKPEKRWTKPVYKKRNCQRCGQLFQPEHPKHKYCSDRCRNPKRAVPVEEKEKPMSPLARLNAEARAHGMRYGEYVAKYGL